METPAGFANHGAFVSCVAKMKDVTLADVDWTTITPESCAAAKDAAKAERDAAKAERKAQHDAKAARQGAKGAEKRAEHAPGALTTYQSRLRPGPVGRQEIMKPAPLWRRLRLSAG